MAKLPVIVGIGGINPAGRTSGFHSYKRMVHEALSKQEMSNTWLDLAHRMGIYQGKPLTDADIAAIIDGTLVRRIDIFDPDTAISVNHKARLDSGFTIPRNKLPDPIPDDWIVEPLDNKEVKVTLKNGMDILIPTLQPCTVSSAGCIPRGFDPGQLYHSMNHPRGLKLTVYGASDVLNSLGIEWKALLKHIKPDQVSVYAGSALAQIDAQSLVGLIAQPLLGNRITSKMMALSLAEMPADFINAYIINNIGTTGTSLGACATFLYNLRQGLLDIQSNKAKVVIVGNAEAPVVPEIIEGFRQMGALADDAGLRVLDNTSVVDNRRACRPFSSNVGFTLAEASQFVVLMDDQLALQCGLTIYGSVADVFINADANKKSITAPGVGNYVTVAKAAALTEAVLGKGGLNQTFVQAHGTGTPLNRTTESHILNEVAKTFSIKQWPIAAVKAYLGHTVSVAAGDQLMAALGVWQYGWIPGIKTIDHIADDVYRSNLNILRDHHYVGEQGRDMQAVLINSKGFGGNNATGVVLSPAKTLNMLKNRHGAQCMAEYEKKNEEVRATSAAMDQQACAGNERVIYHFGKSVMDDTSVKIDTTSIKLSEFEQDISLPSDNPYSEY